MKLTTNVSDIPVFKEKSNFKEVEAAEERIKKQKMEFFKLLTTQLKNQDPLNPMDTTEMTNQIFQINHVEQQLHANKIAEETLSAIKKIQTNNNLQYIDRLVEFPGNKVSVYGNKGIFSYNLPHDVESAKINIFDSNGKLSYSQAISNKAGYQQFIWDKPEHCTDGNYTFSIDAKDKLDENIAVKTFGLGRVDSVINERDGSYLDVMNQKISLDGELRIRSGAESTLLDDIRQKIGNVANILNNKQYGGAADHEMIDRFKNDPKILDAIKNNLKF